MNGPTSAAGSQGPVQLPMTELVSEAATTIAPGSVAALKAFHLSAQASSAAAPAFVRIAHDTSTDHSPPLSNHDLTVTDHHAGDHPTGVLIPLKMPASAQHVLHSAQRQQGSAEMEVSVLHDVVDGEGHLGQLSATRSTPAQIESVDIEEMDKADNEAMGAALDPHFEFTPPSSRDASRRGSVVAGAAEGAAEQEADPISVTISAVPGSNVTDDVEVHIRPQITPADVTRIQTEAQSLATGNDSTQKILQDMITKLKAGGATGPFEVEYELKNDDGAFDVEKFEVKGQVYYKNEMTFTIKGGGTPPIETKFTRTISTNEHTSGANVKPDPKVAVASLINYAKTVAQLATLEKGTDGSYKSALFDESLTDSQYTSLMGSSTFSMSFERGPNDTVTTVKSIKGGPVTLNYKPEARFKTTDEGIKRYEDDTSTVQFKTPPKYEGSFIDAKKKGKSPKEYGNSIIGAFKKDSLRFETLKKNFEANRQAFEEALENQTGNVLDMSTLGDEAREAVGSYLEMKDLLSQMDSKQIDLELFHENLEESTEDSALLEERTSSITGSVRDNFAKIGVQLGKVNENMKNRIEDDRTFLSSIGVQILKKTIRSRSNVSVGEGVAQAAAAERRGSANVSDLSQAPTRGRSEAVASAPSATAANPASDERGSTLYRPRGDGRSRSSTAAAAAAAPSPAEEHVAPSSPSPAFEAGAAARREMEEYLMAQKKKGVNLDNP